jgi:hypothetical protein
VLKTYSSFSLRGKQFLLRLVSAFLVVPLTAPSLLVLQMMLSGGRRMPFGDWIGFVLLYAMFSLAAMVVLGIPLLVLYSRLGWTGFFAFVGGGAVCAAATYTLVAQGQPQLDQFVLFTIFGVVEGFVFRVMLFGFGRVPAC